MAMMSGVCPTIPPEVAVIVVVPDATPVTRPPAEIVALLRSVEPHVTEPVRFWVELSD